MGAVPEKVIDEKLNQSGDSATQDAATDAQEPKTAPEQPEEEKSQPASPDAADDDEEEEESEVAADEN